MLLRARVAQLYTGDRSSHKHPHMSHAKTLEEIQAAWRNVLTVRLAVKATRAAELSLADRRHAPRKALRGCIPKVTFSEILSFFGDKCPQNGAKNDTMAPRTTLKCPHEGPRVDRPTASERKGNHLKLFKHCYLNAKAGIWP